MPITVLLGEQGKGVGKALVAAFLQEAAARDLTKVDLTTDKNNNEEVNAFYQKLGFTCVRNFTTPEGREMNEYLINLQK